MFCPECGTRNIDTAKFCVGCGASLDEARKAAETPPVLSAGTPSSQPDPAGREDRPTRVIVERMPPRDRSIDWSPITDAAAGVLGCGFWWLVMCIGAGFVFMFLGILCDIMDGHSWWWVFGPLIAGVLIYMWIDGRKRKA